MKPRRYSDSLQFNVAQLLRNTTGTSLSYDIDTQSLVNFGDTELKTLSPIVGTIKLLRTGSNILVTGHLKLDLRKSCVRCLENTDEAVRIELEEIFYPQIDINTGTPLPEPDEADSANQISEQHILDLHEVLRQELLLEQSSSAFCQPDCKGLCPQCGENLNLGSCDCKTDKMDSRWADLLTLEIEN